MLLDNHKITYSEQLKWIGSGKKILYVGIKLI